MIQGECKSKKIREFATRLSVYRECQKTPAYGFTKGLHKNVLTKKNINGHTEVDGRKGRLQGRGRSCGGEGLQALVYPKIYRELMNTKKSANVFS